jgi:glucosylceramidase
VPKKAIGLPQKDSSSQVEVVESIENKMPVLQSKPAIRFGTSKLSALTILVDATRAYQTIDGFGASLTESSAWLLKRKLSDTQRRDALEMLFDRKKGIALSILRQPMGASDFALAAYSYDDLLPGETDPDLAKFSIAHDKADILPVMKEILAVNPSVKIIGSPWSPPGWMKTSQSMVQGALLPAAYAPLAKYFVKYIKAYADEGVPIYAITMQNEPVNIPGNYPGMGKTAVEQAAFLREHLGPAFREAALSTKILIFDHNWDLVEFPLQVLSDSKAAAFAAGTATHCYGGAVTAQLELHNRFPEKEIWMTECSGGDWQKGNLLEQQVRLIIGSTRNWAKSVVLWNLALNQAHEPFLVGCTNCHGVMTVNDSASPAQVTPTVDFTALAHVSKFVEPGARRIESNSFDRGSLEDVAFQNPDGSIILLVPNSSGGSVSFNLAYDGKYAPYRLPGGAVATFSWPASAAK